MKLFAVLRAFAPLLVLTYTIISGLVSPVSCHLAAYSETRSFRDALEGRSMEEAISGPVDKDASSYGERTADSGGGPAQGVSPAGGMNIPANGNLNEQQQQVQAPAADEQQKSSNGGGAELEREAGPISPNFPLDTQQQMMEQSVRAKQMRARNDRLSAPKVAGGAMRRARLQQQQQERELGASKEPQQVDTMATTKPAYGNGATEATTSAYDSNGGQQRTSAGDEREQPTNGQQEADEQQQQMYNRQKAASSPMMIGNVAQMADKLAMAMMLKKQQRAGYAQPASMSGAMKSTNRNAATNTKGTQQVGVMGQSMMMSLANKAAYMAKQQRRQMAPPPMMLPMSGAYGSGGAGAPVMNSDMAPASLPSDNDYQNGANGNGEQLRVPNMKASNYQMPAVTLGNGMGPMRAMRRANQRKAEKKISPAMMNAMLNKMLAARLPSGEALQQQPENSLAENYKAMSMANLMKSAAGAEMLASMMVMNSNGAAAMSAGRRDQYKRMLMGAIMQQQKQQQKAERAYADGEQQVGGAIRYGERSRAPAAMMSGAKTAGSMGPVPTSPMSEPTVDSAQMGRSYMGNQQQQPEEQAAVSYEQQKQQEMLNGGAGMRKMMSAGEQSYGNQQQQMKDDQAEGQQREMGAYGSGSAGETSGMALAGPVAMQAVSQASRPTYGQSMLRPKTMRGSYGGNSANENGANKMSAMQMAMMMMNKMDGAKAKMYGANGVEQPQQEMDAQQREGSYGSTKPMGAADMPMNGFSQSYSSPDVQQQQQMTANEREAYGQQADSKSAGDGTETAAGPQRPVSLSYGTEDGSSDQQQQQQQEREEGYGAAPMGMAEPFAFNYETQDNYGNGQYRKEESDKNGVVRGSYGYMDNSGIFRHVEYVADENGFRAKIKSNEPGLSSEPAARGAKSGEGQQAAGGPDEAAQMDQMPLGRAGPMASPVAPAPQSSSSSLGGPSGAGDASLSARLQLQQQQQVQQDTQVPMTPPLAASLMQPERELQQQRQYGAGGNGAQQEQMNDNGSGVEK